LKKSRDATQGKSMVKPHPAKAADRAATPPPQCDHWRRATNAVHEEAVKGKTPHVRQFLTGRKYNESK
jgi:hypothetical protein